MLFFQSFQIQILMKIFCHGYFDLSEAIAYKNHIMCYCCWQVVEVPNVSWDDIGGLENVKRELQEVVLIFCILVPHVQFNVVKPFAFANKCKKSFCFLCVDCSIPSGTS